jgi:hypothetical protein
VDVHVHLIAFLGVAAVLVVTPGVDTALVTKNALLYGRHQALASAWGSISGSWSGRLLRRSGWLRSSARPPPRSMCSSSPAPSTLSRLASSRYGPREHTPGSGKSGVKGRPMSERLACVPAGAPQQPSEPQDRSAVHRLAAAVHRPRRIGAPSVAAARRSIQPDGDRVAMQLRAGSLAGSIVPEAVGGRALDRAPQRGCSHRARHTARRRASLADPLGGLARRRLTG